MTRPDWLDFSVANGDWWDLDAMIGRYHEPFSVRVLHDNDRLWHRYLVVAR